MNQSTSTTAGEAGLYPGGGNLNIPKRGGLWKYIAIGSAATIAGIAGYQVLKNDDVNTDIGRETVSRKTITNPDGIKRGIGPKYTENEARINWSDKDRPPAVGNLAEVKGKIVYPNDVDKGMLGDYKYDLTNFDHFLLALVEGIKNKDKKLLTKLTGREAVAEDIMKNIGDVKEYHVRGYGGYNDETPS